MHPLQTLVGSVKRIFSSKKTKFATRLLPFIADQSFTCKAGQRTNPKYIKRTKCSGIYFTYFAKRYILRTLVNDIFYVLCYLRSATHVYWHPLSKPKYVKYICPLAVARANFYTYLWLAHGTANLYRSLHVPQPRDKYIQKVAKLSART